MNGVVYIKPEDQAINQKIASKSSSCLPPPAGRAGAGRQPPFAKGGKGGIDKLVISFERKLKELTVLYEISQLIGSALNCQEVLSDTLNIFHSRLGMNRGTITLLNSETGELEIRAAHGMTEEEVKRGRYLVGEGITGKVVETGEPVAVPQIEKEPLFLNRTRSRDNLKKSDISSKMVRMFWVH